MEDIVISVIKILSLGAIASVISVLLTPFLTNILYKHKLWRKEVRKKTIDGKEAVYFNKFNSEREVSVPRFGGVLIWLVALLVALIFFFLANIFPDIYLFQKFNFLSRSQTWLPFFALTAAGILGFLDDFLQVKGKGKYIAGGLTFLQRFLIVLLIGLIGGWWFFAKLDIQTIHIPGNGDFYLGMWYILLFIIVTLACWSGGVIDGIDGLAGGVFAVIFGAFSIIAFFNNQIDIAAFCSVIAGTTLSFLWFNIPPARFYMGETGSLALTVTLAVVAFLTDSVLVLPIIAAPLVVEAGSVIIQLISKKFFKKKIFLASPLHYHLEAKGWEREKITMRFWIFSVVLAIIGITIRLLG